MGFFDTLYSNVSDDSQSAVLFTLSEKQTELQAIDFYRSSDINNLLISVGFNSTHTEMTVVVTDGMQEDSPDFTYKNNIQDI